MNSTRLALILSPLALAGATAVIWQGDAGTEERVRPALTRGSVPSRPPPVDGFFESGSDAEIGETRLATRSDPSTSPAVVRLHELTEVLGLSSDQRREVRHFLERSSVSYEESPPIIGVSGQPLARLTAVQVQEGIHDLLDPLQQAEYEDLLIDEQLWWADVIARLEKDLEQATDPVPDLVEPEESAPPEAPSHRGGNIFDLLNPPES